MLMESLCCLDRCEVTHNAADQFERSGRKLPDVSAELLKAAKKELRACRRQLTLWRMIWGTFRHRDERAIRKPLWRLQERQRFRDGARVAELLVTVRQSLKEGRCRTRDRLRARMAIWVTATITGDRTTIKEVLKSSRVCAGKVRRPGASSAKTRWLPWQQRTPSWQAAYNTACLYSALYSAPDDSCKCSRDAMARLVVASLKRVVDDRACDMERPSDWISQDPDFSSVRSSSKEFKEFLDAQRRRDYPAPRHEPAHR